MKTAVKSSFTSLVLHASLRVTWAVAVCMVVMPAVGTADDGRISDQVDAVMSRAIHLGMPILAVASTDSCEEAPRLKQRLITDPAVQPLVARFAFVELRMSGDDKWTWKRWQQRFDTHRRQSPQVFVVRADGKKLFSGDPPGDLPGFLRRHAGQAGQMLAARQADLFTTQLETAAHLQAEGNLAEAVRIVTPAARLPSFALPVVRSVAFRAAAAKRLLAEIERVAAQPLQGADLLAAAEMLVATADEYAATLPDVTRAARELLTEIGRDPAGRETVRQAQLLHHAAAAARRSPGRGLALYEQIIASHPDSPAAEVAAVRLRSIDDGSR